MVTCDFCGRKATRLCDAPIGTGGFCGHPPRFLMQKAHHTDTAFQDLRMNWTETCARPICDDCAIEIYHNIDFCPACIQHIKERAAAKRRPPHDE